MDFSTIVIEMNKLLILALMLLPVSLSAQVKKLPGEPATFTWNFLVADEPKISGFRLYSSTVQTGPYTNLTGNTGASVRTLTIPASFTTGTVKTFYVVRSYLSTGGGTVESGDSNSTEVILSAPTPTNLQVK